MIAVNLGILGYFWFSMGDSPVQPLPTATNPPAAAVSSIEPPRAVEPSPVTPVAHIQTPPQTRSVPTSAPTPVYAPEPAAKPQSFDQGSNSSTDYQQEEPPLPKVGYLPQLEELPAYERDSIPDMTFSSHMYSSMPRFRSIIINGKRLKEGQYLNEDLQVREITESGVIMSAGNTLFEVDVLGRWAQ